METFLISLASFACGGFLTAMGFIYGWSNKITTIIDNQKVQTDNQKAITESLAELKKNFYNHVSTPQPQCPMHTGVLMDVDRLKNKVGIQ
jgi:hypothetical protein